MLRLRISLSDLETEPVATGPRPLPNKPTSAG